MKSFINLSQQHGITLIELMIVILLLSYLLFMGASLTRSWVDYGQVNSALSDLKNAVYQAKSAALRNTNNQPLNRGAVSICWDQPTSTLNVIRPGLNTTDLCDVSNTNNELLQTFKLADGIDIQKNSNLFKCMAFNSAGILVATPGMACSIQPDLMFTVEKNNESADITLM